MNRRRGRTDVAARVIDSRKRVYPKSEVKIMTPDQFAKPIVFR